MKKPQVVFFLGMRTRDSVLADEDLRRLQKIARVRLVSNPAKRKLSQEEVVSICRDTPVVVTTWGGPPLTRKVLDGCPALKLFARLGGSLRGNIDTAAWQRGIRVVTAADAQGRIIADLTVSLILAGLHRFPFYVRQQSGPGALHDVIDAKRVPQRSLIGKRVGLVGVGAVSRHVVQLLQPFACSIAAFDPYVKAAAFASLGIRRMTRLAELCAWSEVLSVHAALTPETRGMINRTAIRRLPVGALLVNTSFGELIDQRALAERLRRRDLFACLDMVEGGMPGPRDPLRHEPHCMITPTISFYSDGVRLMGRQIVDELVRFLCGKPLKHEVWQNTLKTRA